ncbi:MAG: glycosyltransferase family 4 protein [Bacilli bacterium]|nr:glycosyltransferase family 4 protein [Bacilli bacterium]
MNVLWIFNHPAPYKVKFFNELGKKCNLQVIFERDREGDRNDIFYSEKPYNFKSHICKSLKLGKVNNYTSDPVKFLKKNKYDLVVINGWYTLGERKVISYCKRHKIEYIFAINGGIVPKKELAIKRKIKTKYISGASLYLSPDLSSNKYLCHYGADEEKIRIFPYSNINERVILKNPLTKEEKQRLRKKYDLEGDEIFVTCGQFIERKNFLKLIEIWAQVPPNLSLYIIGEGPLKQQYLDKIKSLELKNVHILPFQESAKLFSIFSACDKFIFISKEDIYGQVVIEALSQGLPVIGSNNANALVKTITHNLNGVIVNINSDESILEGIKKKLPEEASEICLEEARKNTIENSSAFHIELFKEFIKENESK